MYLHPISKTDVAANFLINNRYPTVDTDPGKYSCFSVVLFRPSTEFSLVASESCEFLQLRLDLLKPRVSRYRAEQWVIRDSLDEFCPHLS